MDPCRSQGGLLLNVGSKMELTSFLASIIIISVIVLSALNIYASALWHWEIKPLVKRYTGGKTNSYGLTNVGMLLDYFLARNIIKNENLSPIWQVKFFGIVVLLDVIIPLGIAGIVMISK
jgi:hypothetical protein